jgi:hypothetical protein
VIITCTNISLRDQKNVGDPCPKEARSKGITIRLPKFQVKLVLGFMYDVFQWQQYRIACRSYISGSLC